MKIAFYGGSFNPPHVAHVLAATYVLSVGWVDQVLVVPVFSHAFMKPLADYAHRVRMAELALGWLPGVQVSTVESKLPAPSRTLVTLEHLKSAQPEAEFRLLIGADQLAELPKWYGFERLLSLAPALVLGRAGAEQPPHPDPVLPGVSSTRVRELLAGRAEQAFALELARSVPRSVLEYIESQGLYSGA